jgi:BolA family transcriptional regulator, general stress-responsive regulator
MKKMIKDVEQQLLHSLSVDFLEVIDESELHAGHVGRRESGLEVSHIHIKIRSSSLTGLTRVAQQRKLYEVLDPFIQQGLHAVRFSIV